MDSFSQTFMVIPASLIVFFIYKKFITKDDDRRIIGDTLVVGILTACVLYFYNKNTNSVIQNASIRTKTNF